MRARRRFRRLTTIAERREAMSRPLRPHGVFLACICGIALAATLATAAHAGAKPVPPDRWVRRVCSGWSEYADDDTIASGAVDDLVNDLKAGEVKPNKARERLLRCNGPESTASVELCAWLRRA